MSPSYLPTQTSRPVLYSRMVPMLNRMTSIFRPLLSCSVASEKPFSGSCCSAFKSNWCLLPTEAPLSRSPPSRLQFFSKRRPVHVLLTIASGGGGGGGVGCGSGVRVGEPKRFMATSKTRCIWFQEWRLPKKTRRERGKKIATDRPASHNNHNSDRRRKRRFIHNFIIFILLMSHFTKRGVIAVISDLGMYTLVCWLLLPLNNWRWHRTNELFNNIIVNGSGTRVECGDYIHHRVPPTPQ